MHHPSEAKQGACVEGLKRLYQQGAYFAGIGKTMELRHLRFFIAVAEAAASQRPPSSDCTLRNLR